MHQKCSLPSGVSGGEDDGGVWWLEDGWQPWTSFEEFIWEQKVGRTIHVHYCASDPTRVVSIGGIWLNKNKIIITKGYETDGILFGMFAWLLGWVLN